MHPAGFKPAISTGERRQIYALDRAATGIGNENTSCTVFTFIKSLITLRLKTQLYSFELKLGETEISAELYVGYAVTLLVEAPRDMPEGRRFYSRWGHWPRNRFSL